MSRGLSPSDGSGAYSDGSPHLVVKRGHRGRYRFMMIENGERIGGEVHVGTEDGRDDSRSRALARIARLAKALLGGLAPQPLHELDAGSDLGVDAAGPSHPTFGEGDHRGQV